MRSASQSPLFAASSRIQREVAGQTRAIERLTAQLKAFSRELTTTREQLAAESTARRQAEQAFAESQQKYRFLADSLPQIVWTSKPDGNLDYYNQRWLDYTGMTFDETKDWGWKHVMHPEDFSKCAERWTEAFTTGRAYELEYRLRRASDGSYRWHLGRAFPLRNEWGEIVQWVGTCTDIDDQKRAAELMERRVEERTAELLRVNDALEQEVMERNRAELANAEIFSNSLDVICTIDEQGRFSKISGACETVWGYTPEELVGRPYMELVHPEDRERTWITAEEIMAGRAAKGFENRYICKDGSVVPVMWTANWSEAAQAMFCVARDMSEVKRSNAELKRAKEVAEAANRAKSDFLANMSHEIRTPMNGVLGMVDLALSSEPASQLKHYLQTVQNSAESLLSIIDDILDFSKIEAGRLELESIPFDVRDVVNNTVTALSGRAAMKGLSLTWNVDKDLPARCMGDPTRLRQILTNLVGNGLKFTERGSVDVKVNLQAADSEGVCLHFYVTDTGPGISDDVQQGIFEAFQQADTSTSRRFGGTGLGLSICRSLVMQMGGRIAVESTVGKGSSFHFTVRLQVAEPNAESESSRVMEAPAAMPLQQARLRVLLTEDNRVNQEVAASILRNAGHAVIVAQNGREAMELAAKEEFDLIFMDVQMPEMDGLEATAAIRAIERKRSTHTPIIAMTAHAMEGDRDRCLAGGMDDYLSKPFRKPDLLTMLDRWSKARRVSEASLQGGSKSSAQGSPAVSIHRDWTLLEELLSDAELLTKLQDSWKQEGPATLMSLEYGVDAGDFVQAARAAHTLMGLFGSVGDNHGYELSRSVEESCLGGDLKAVQRAIPKLRAELGVVTTEIARLSKKSQTS